MAAHPSISTRTNAGVLLALLAFGMASPLAARAGCLHPPGGASRPGAGRLDLLAAAGALAIDEPLSPPPPRSPCDGLRCSGDPAPTPSPTMLADVRVESWGCLPKAPPPLNPDSDHLPPSSSALQSSHGGPVPFHPPR
ncbi:hypothetical protein [Paludisphaera mucosa]|uniref:Uncharacterized protein n=1 Tax=Paludisphaera mucosa TaxID=3030827 RepID=A0ABT6FH87_9BACT|nr:hypothetical protein [Paludisphaera mucosa]MDG3006924.1 hypothetical protein [Paludisphaera mucosa]